MSRLLMISSDCHAGALPATYNEYLPQAYREAANEWWAGYIREMLARVGTFFDQEAMDRFAEQAAQDDEREKVDVAAASSGDDAILAMLQDEKNPFAPRRGEFDPDVRARELDDDGVAGEVVFPQMAPFGAGLLDYRNPVTPDQDLEGCRAYNRWLADFCSHEPERHAGVALVTLDDMDVTVAEVRAAREMGLWGGILLPGTTGDLPYYHHPRYEPLWAVCEELGLPLQVHSGWSPDYGDAEAATPMYITEVAMWAHRPFAALVWSGAFERRRSPTSPAISRSRRRSTSRATAGSAPRSWAPTRVPIATASASTGSCGAPTTRISRAPGPTRRRRCARPSRRTPTTRSARCSAPRPPRCTASTR